MPLYLNAVTPTDPPHKGCGPMFKNHFHYKYGMAANEGNFQKKKVFLWPEMSFQRAHIAGYKRPEKYPGKSSVDLVSFLWNRMDVFQVLHYLSNRFLSATINRQSWKIFFFSKISAVHQRFYLNCSYKKLMKALSCWATKWQEWILVRWNLLKIHLSKRFCINISLSDSVHMHLQYRTRPGGGEFHANLLIICNKARTQHSSM